MAIFIGTSRNDFLLSKQRGDILLGVGGDDTLVARHGWNILLGGEGNDQLIACSSFNTLSGGTGNDVLRAHGSWNLLLGGDGDDYLYALGNNNLLTGDAGNDTFQIDHGSSARGNTLNGGSGNDLFNIFGGSGNSVIGGFGNDTASYSGTMLGVQIDLSSGTAAGAEIGAGSLSTIENVIGGAGNDMLAGDTNANRLEGGEGNDTIKGGAGNDFLLGGSGTDTLSYADSPGRVVVNLSSFTTISLGGEIVEPGTARDGFGTSDVVSGFENVLGSSFDDVLLGNEFAADRLEGGAGNDELHQTGGADHLDGGPGTDRLVFDTGFPTASGVDVDLAAGTSDQDRSDPFNPVATLASIELVTGTFFDDSFFGGDATHAANLFGDRTTETFRPLGGNDTVTGAPGREFSTRVDYATNSIFEPVHVNLATGMAFDGWGGMDTLVHVDQVFGGAGDDSILGGSQERSASGAFFELFRGNAGNDTIDGAGTDFIVRGAGTDRVNYVNSPNAVIVNLSTAPFLAGLEWVAGGTARDGWATFANGFNVLGDTDILINIDQVEGSNLNDTLVGGAGNHRLIGGAGDDWLVGLASGVEASYQSSAAAVYVDLESGIAFDGLGGTDTLVNIDDARGSNFNDTLIGNADNNRLVGEPGADTIDGGDGVDLAGYLDTPLSNGGIDAFLENGAGLVNDGMGSTDTLINIEGLIGTHSDDMLRGGLGDQWFIGRGGSDTINGGPGSDWVSYEDDPAGVSVDLNGGIAFDGWGGVWGFGGIDSLLDMENAAGSAFNDFLMGSDAANLLDGGAGNDTLVGGNATDSADDTLLGGLGDDELRQTRGADHLDGGFGTDRLTFFSSGIAYGGATGVHVDLAAGSSDYDTSDPFNPHGTLASIELVIGTAGNDTFVGGDPAHAPNFFGNQISESFRPLGGDDTIIGGPGVGFNARVDYVSNNSLQPVYVNLGAGIAYDGMGGTDTLVAVSQVFSGAGHDTLIGGTDERAPSGSFLELFRGNAGNDIMDGAGTTTTVGANDRVNYVNSPSGVIVNLSARPYWTGSEWVAGGTAHDGFGFIDTLINVNQIDASNFNDTLVGGASNHLLIGEGGDDLLVGAVSGVEASYQNAPTGVVANLATGTASDGQGGTDTLINISDLRGSDFNDILTGNAANNTISGEPGADTIDGGDGIDFASYSSTPLANGGINAFIENGSGMVGDGYGSIDTLIDIEGLIGTHSDDTLRGGLGDQWFRGRGGSDTIDGGDGSDTADYSGDPGAVTVNLAAGTAFDGWGGVWGFGGIDTLFEIENVKGSRFDDSITGDAGANEIDGGGGADTVEGGGGADVFQFGLSASGGTILDFSDDFLDFSSLFGDAGVVVPGGEDPLEWLVNQGYLSADSTADVTGGPANDTIVRVDFDGSGGAEIPFTVVTLTDVTLGTTGTDADNWLV
jgi:Ca2+-binding RTX toxin-like protein